MVRLDWAKVDMTAAVDQMPAAHHVRRRLAVLAVMLGLLAALAVPVPTAVAHADAGMESAFVSEINRERAAVGLGSVSTAGDLASVARAHSAVMARQDHLHHNPNLGSDVSGWQKVGENVGRGPTVSALHAAFMDSPGHKANVLDPDWTQVGVGVVVHDGTVWVTVVFRLPQGASKPAPPPPEPEPAPAADTEPASGSSGSSSSGGSSNDGTPASAAAPVAEPEPDPEPEPEPHEVVEQPLHLDRVTLILARDEAAERLLRLDDVLAGAS